MPGSSAANSQWPEVTSTPARRRRRWLTPMEPVPRSVYLATAAASFILLLGIWCALAYGGIVRALFLPSPTSILASGVQLFAEFGFLGDVWATVYRVFGGFLLAALIAVPLGVLMGSFKLAEAFFEPMTSFLRYMPASAFIPLFILWLGIGDVEKVAVIFLGSFFSLLLMVAVEVRSVRRELMEAAYTLGASRASVVYKVIFPAAMPGIYDVLLLILGWSWTYIIVAELVAAEAGIGHVILQAQRMLRTGDIIFGILVIGVIGLLSDSLLKLIGKRLFAWRG